MDIARDVMILGSIGIGIGIVMADKIAVITPYSASGD
jgi:hypothetical protein